MADKWLYRAFGQEFGPVSFDELKNLTANGFLSADSEVRSTDTSRWQLYSDVVSRDRSAGDVNGGEARRSDPEIDTVKGSDEWYYGTDGAEIGPVSFNVLLQLAQSHQLTADDLVKLGSQGKWRRVGSIGRLMAVLPFQAEVARPAGASVRGASKGNKASSTTSIPESSPPGGTAYLTAYTQAKENIAGLIISQAEAAYQAAEARAKAEIAWALAPNIENFWWGWMGGFEYGPVGIQQVLALVRNGQVKPSDFVRHGQYGQYVPVSSVPGLLNAATIIANAHEMLTLARTQAKAAVDLAPPPVVAPTTSATINSLQTTPAAGIKIPKEVAAKPKQRHTNERPAEPVPINAGQVDKDLKRKSPVPQIDQKRDARPKPVAAIATIPTAVSESPKVEAADIYRRVRESFEARNLPGLSRIELELSDGAVTLRGTLSTEGERLLAVRLAQQTPGIDKVIDSLSVSGGTARPAVARSSPAVAPVKSWGPGVLSELFDKVKGQNPIHAAAAVLVTSILGFGYWTFASGPSRPVSVHPVKGNIVMDGTSLANASIVLHRVGDSKIPANLHPRARVKEDGSFVLETFDPADGAPDGDFIATVFLNEVKEVNGEKQMGPNILPVVYSRPETSPLKLKITPSTSELQPLELSKK